MNVIEGRFYIYEHWRPDTDTCFYVGKGHDDRAYRFRRNNYYNHIVGKLARAGLKPEVRIVKSDLDEASALSLEVELIAHWKSIGVTLANITDGGEGVSGLKHTEETRAKIREKRANQRVVCSQETRKKIGMAQKGVPKSPEQRLKQSHIMTGRKLSKEHCAAIAAGNVGGIRSREARSNMSRAQLGHPTSKAARMNMSQAHLGKKLSIEHRKRMSEAQKKRWNKFRFKLMGIQL